MALVTLLIGWLFFVGDNIYIYWLITFLATLLLGLAGQLYRYRRLSTPLERQQTKWVVIGLALFISTLTVLSLFQALSVNTSYRGWLSLIAAHCSWLALACLPITLAFSIFRYRLWDIDPLINRTLVYGGLTLLVLALYGGIVFGLGAAFGSSGNVLLAVIATGVVAIVFNPLRQRLQRAVNRLMYGDRDDPATVLAHLGQQLESALAPNSVLPTIVETVARALKAPYAAIEVNGDQSPVISAEWKADNSLSPTDHLATIPLTYQAETIGRLLIAPRAPGEVFSPADLRLLNNLVRQAAPAVHAQRLTADLHR